MRCPQCQYENTVAAKFCQECGQRLAPHCPACGFETAASAKFCPECGHALRRPAPTAEVAPLPETPQGYTPRHLTEHVLTSRSALEGERKHVTVLFCDLVRSTDLAERLGPDTMHSLLNRFFEIALNEIHRYKGTINQFLGDGFMALFGAPIAYEDHAPRAALAALGLQRTLRNQLHEPHWPAGQEFEVRMGLHTGLVVVGSIGDNLRMDYTAVGDTAHLAARLQQRAAPGTILASKATAQFIRGHVHLEALAPARIKGIRTPVTAYRVVGRRPRRSPLAMLGERTLSRFTGRKRELAILRELLKKVEAGEGQAVGIVGEAGVGKSRLLYEFRRHHETRVTTPKKHLTYLEGYCLSYGSTVPYLPVISMLRNHFDITETDSQEAIIEKVHLGLQAVDLEPEARAPYLLHLLGIQEAIEQLTALSPEAINARIFETLRLMSLHGSLRRPVVFIVEDLQWIDKTSEACFAKLVEGLAGAPILFLATYRPGYRPPWLGTSYASQLALHHLAPQESLTLIRSVLPDTRLPEALIEAILARGDGNPFFLEELTRAVAERGELPPHAAVPNTIQGVLMARIDRLPDIPKRLLQTAAVIGRDIPLRLLELVWDDTVSLEAHLQELQRLEFLYERIGVEEPEYSFKHPLTQEVAYASLLASRRQTLHAAVGQALERLYADRLEEAYDRLAYHYAKTPHTAKAVTYLMRFADKAARSFAHAEVVTALREALEHAEQLPAAERPRRLLEIVLQQVHSLILLGHFPEALRLLLQYRTHLDELQEPQLAGPYNFWLGLMYALLGDRQLSDDYAQHAFDEAERAGDAATLGKACYVLSMNRYWAGQPQQGVVYGRQAVTHLEAVQEPYWLGMAHAYLSLNAYLMGEFATAMAALERARDIGNAIDNARLLSVIAWITGWIYATWGEWDTGIEWCRRSLDSSPDPLNTAGALGYLGAAYLEKGEVSQAMPLLEQSIEHWSQFRFPQLQGWFTALLGEALLQSGQLAKGHTLATQGLTIARQVQFWYGVGIAQRTLGRSAQMRGALDEADQYLSDALQTFTTMPAPFEVGRTHLALAELARQQGQHDIGAHHIQEAYRLFETLGATTYLHQSVQRAAGLGVSLPVATVRESVAES
jgi:class 3 adenylate cyclase/tetratricopeptide (TPR) repeat protein